VVLQQAAAGRPELPFSTSIRSPALKARQLLRTGHLFVVDGGQVMR
jgi:hypothetical protein